jgi:hypothetical protein
MLKELMAKKNKKNSRTSKYPTLSIRWGHKTIRFIIDRVLIFRLMRTLHGRFWGIAGLLIMTTGFVVCILIRREMLTWSTAFSDFGKDVRTAPYLAVSLFFGAYGLWRWRNYLKRTLRHARPVTSLVGLTVMGLYIAALMPVAWEPVPYRLHLLGVTIAGLSMAATVVVDSLLTKTRQNKSVRLWRFFRLCSFLFIVAGGYLTFGSSNVIVWFDYALLGELMMLVGYTIWIVDKTFRGEGSRSKLSYTLHKIVLVD